MTKNLFFTFLIITFLFHKILLLNQVKIINCVIIKYLFTSVNKNFEKVKNV